MPIHWTIYIDNNSHTSAFINAVLQQKEPNFKYVDAKSGALFSPLAVTQFIAAEERHGTSALQHEKASLITMSSGQQKKALLFHLLKQQPDYIILHNPFDNLDVDFQVELQGLLQQHAQDIIFIQLTSRKRDVLPFVTNFGILNNDKFERTATKPYSHLTTTLPHLRIKIPDPITHINTSENTLISFNQVSVSYLDQPILNNISWHIKKGEFWQLVGSNGSGKTTLLSMIIGDNPKAYGQDITIFGQPKGSGETVWDIKEKIGYYSAHLTDKFNGRHTTEYMLISGITDAIGLYTKPTEAQLRTAKQWLHLLHLWDKRHCFYNRLSLGEQRLVMTARAMIKHPPLLILDEPTAGMDDAAAGLLVALVNKMAAESTTTIVFVSHRSEPGLTPQSTYTLTTGSSGSVGRIL